MCSQYKMLGLQLSVEQKFPETNVCLNDCHRLGYWTVPCHWARQCPNMAPSLNLTGEEKLETIFIPVISVLVSKRLVHAMGTNDIQAI